MSQILIDEALGITDSTPPKIIAERWTYWKTNFSSEYIKLDSSTAGKAYIAYLDTITTLYGDYAKIVAGYNAAKNTYDNAVATYNGIMAGITAGASKTMLAAEATYKSFLNVSVKDVATNLYNSAKDSITTIIENESNISVDSSTALPDVLPE